MDSQWQPIEKYKRGCAVFYFEATPEGRNHLAARVELTRHFGSRVCTMFMPFDMPPKETDNG